MYRSHYAYAGKAMLTAPDGTPTGAISGFFNSLFSVIDEYKPTNVCVTFDVHAPTFRHKLSADYKATRKPMPDELKAQMPVLKNILDLMGIARIEKETFEADDLIGTISKIASLNGDKTFIYSGDHDDFQLIDENVSVVLPQSGKGKPPRLLVTNEVFEEMYGISPSKFIYVKALMGDNSDNIKGIDKVGEKTAFKLIQDYGDIDNIYKNLDSIKGALHKNLEGQEQHLELSLKLCTIDRDVDIDLDLDDTVLNIEKSQALCDELNRLALKAVLKKLDMGSMKASQIDIAMSDEKKDLTSEYAPKIENIFKEGVVVTDASSSEIVKVLKEVFDSLSDDDKKLPFYSVSFFNGALLVAVKDKKEVFRSDLSSYEEIIRSVKENSIDSLPASFDYKTSSKVLVSAPRDLKAVFDTEICAYVLNAVSGNDVSFRTVFERTTGLSYPIENDDSVGQMSLFDTVDTDTRLLNAAGEALLYIYTADVQAKQIETDGLRTLLYGIEFPLIITLDKIERNGMYVSKDELLRLHDDFRSRLDEIEKKIYELTGEEFLISSPKQLSYVLFDKLGLKHGKKGKTGVYSTNAEVLQSLVTEHPVISYILEYRALSKLDSTYATGLVDKIADDGRIRTTFTQAMTNTGRLSSTEPNLQNIPVRSSEGEKIRNAFEAPEGKVLVDADYSQIELRLLAAMSGDEVMTAAFKNGQDIHRSTAAGLFGCPEEEVTSKQRSAAKTVNFSIVYGVTEYGLSQDLHMSYNEAKALIESYRRQFPKVTSYLDSLKAKGESDGYVETKFGRRRYLNELKSQNKNLREFGLRAAMNTPIQGTAADIIKIAMNKVSDALEAKIPGAKLIMQVHDELIVECDEKDAKECAKLLKEEMENAVKLNVPLVADCGIGKTWLEAK